MKTAVKSRIIRIIWIIYFLCVIPALFTLAWRMKFDREFNSVALVVDYIQLLELAQTENIPLDDVLDRVRDEAGIDHVALLEDTPQFLSQRGLCTIVEGVGWPGWKTPEEREDIRRNQGREVEVAEAPSTDWPLLMGLDHDMTHLIFTDPDVFQRIADTSTARYPGLVEVIDQGDDGGIVSLAGEPKIVLEWGMGFDPELVYELRSEGFILYPRLRHYFGYDIGIMEAIQDDAASIFPEAVIIFEGDSVFAGGGFRTSSKPQLPVSWMKFGWIEFAEQFYADHLAERIPTRTVRVHSIEDEEMEVVTIEDAVERYVRAVRERAVRIVYMKPFLLQSDRQNRFEKSIELFTGVRETLESNSFIIGEPSTVYKSASPGFFTGFLSGLLTPLSSVIALVIGLVLLLTHFQVRLSSLISIIIFLIILISLIVLGWFGQKIIALGLSVISPTLAVAWLVNRYEIISRSNPDSLKKPILTVLQLWLGTVAITLVGALLIGAALINEKTLLAIDSFSGVKIGLNLPVIFAVLIGLQLIVPVEKRTFSGGLSWLLNFPIKIWHVVLGVGGLIAIFMMIDRSGNFPIIPVAEWENDIRGWFETVLYARPRTKEMFFGHPGLVLGMYLGLSSMRIRRPLMYIGVVIGSIALTSLTNTFCHIHTPIILSIFRTVAGGVIGCVIGLVAGLIVTGIWKMIGRLVKNKRDKKSG